MSSKELKYCFQNVSAERLRSLLDTICDVSDETRAIFEQELLTQEQSATLRKTKPGQPRYLKCENCEKEFDVTENIKDSCNYHEGELETNDDFWVDDDQYDHDPSYPLESEYHRKTFPEGFIWDCCDEQLDAPGCIVQKHEHKLDEQHDKVDGREATGEDGPVAKKARIE
ncbi:hypothetical protein D6D24_10743 [Aureobasidium pullulans]|uniref:C2H2-type domain-containing protein n=1 Tax=Aureobasidium pullulans TaxID=5580 RepID=A0A4S8UWJ1_AURPU|nr:hypothetical protein D6D24_10743 [Aureobasidium pullulans]